MSKNRMYEGRLNYLTVTLAAIAVSLPLFILGIVVEWDIGLTLSLVGLLLAFVVPILFEVRAQRTRPRQVVFLDYRRHHFGASFARGLEDSLRSSNRPWDFEYLRPSSSGTEEALKYQIGRLKEAETDGTDGVVVLPEKADAALWQAMLRCVNADRAVVVVDIRPDSGVFELSGVSPPFFVASDYALGGRLVASLIEEHLEADETARALLLVGPKGSWAGEERSRQMVMDLLLAGFMSRVDFMLIEDWDVTEQRCAAALERIGQDADTDWIIYAGDDEHAIALHSFMQNEAPDVRKRCKLIGYDATGNEFGHLPVFEFGAAEWTIDVDPEEQGREVARHLLSLRLGQEHPRAAASLVKPRVIDRADYNLTRT